MSPPVFSAPALDSFNATLNSTLESTTTTLDSSGITVDINNTPPPPPQPSIYEGFDLDACCPLKIHFNDVFIYFQQKHPQSIYPISPSVRLRSIRWTQVVRLEKCTTESVLRFHLNFIDPTAPTKRPSTSPWPVSLSNRDDFISDCIRRGLLKLDLSQCSPGSRWIAFTPVIRVRPLPMYRSPPDIGYCSIVDLSTSTTSSTTYGSIEIRILFADKPTRKGSIFDCVFSIATTFIALCLFLVFISICYLIFS